MLAPSVPKDRSTTESTKSTLDASSQIKPTFKTDSQSSTLKLQAPVTLVSIEPSASPPASTQKASSIIPLTTISVASIPTNSEGHRDRRTPHSHPTGTSTSLGREQIFPKGYSGTLRDSISSNGSFISAPDSPTMPGDERTERFTSQSHEIGRNARGIRNMALQARRPGWDLDTPTSQQSGSSSITPSTNRTASSRTLSMSSSATETGTPAGKRFAMAALQRDGLLPKTPASTVDSSVRFKLPPKAPVDTSTRQQNIFAEPGTKTSTIAGHPPTEPKALRKDNENRLPAKPTQPQQPQQAQKVTVFAEPANTASITVSRPPTETKTPKNDDENRFPAKPTQPQQVYQRADRPSRVAPASVDVDDVAKMMAQRLALRNRSPQVTQGDANPAAGASPLPPSTANRSSQVKEPGASPRNPIILEPGEQKPSASTGDKSQKNDIQVKVTAPSPGKTIVTGVQSATNSMSSVQAAMEQSQKANTQPTRANTNGMTANGSPRPLNNITQTTSNTLQASNTQNLLRVPKPVAPAMTKTDVVKAKGPATQPCLSSCGKVSTSNSS